MHTDHNDEGSMQDDLEHNAFDGAHVYFFSGEIPQGDPEGDQAELFRRIQTLSTAPKQVHLERFLRQATIAVREEIAKLPKDVQRLAPWVQSILHWTHHAVALRKTCLGGSIDRALVCVYQMGLLLVHRTSLTATSQVPTQQTCLLGKGIGLLTAACLALSSDLDELANLGAIAVRIAFRTGLVVDRMSGSLEVCDPFAQSWKSWLACIHGVTEQAIQCEVDKYNISQNIPQHRAAFICNTTEHSVSVSGPPSTLEGLLPILKQLPGAKCVPMPKIQGVSHAEHLYTSHDVSWIVPVISSQSTVRSQIILPTSGPVSTGTTCTELFRMIVGHDLSTKQTRTDVDVDSVNSLLNLLGTIKCRLYTVRHSSHAEELRSRLQARVGGIEISDIQLPHFLALATKMDNAPRRSDQSKIAVVGMSCRFPDGADGVEKLWDLLAGGHDAHRTVPADRFDVRTHVDPTGQTPNASKTPYGCFINEPGLFDAAFFSMSRREAEQTDPMQRLALITAHEALEHAGYTQNSSGISPHRIGTFYGQASDDYREANSNQHVGTYYIPGGCRAFGPGRVNYFYRFSGPSFSCDTACSSSLATLQLACTSLWANDADMLVVGGLNVLTNCDVFAGLSHGHFLSKSGGCKTWDKDADGYCRADGVGSIVLKRLEDAEADNDNVLGLILSAATNHSAEAVSITHPHTGSQSALYRQVIWRAGLDARDVGYVEFHGTGTQSGDATELAAVTDVFAPLTRSRSTDQPIYIGSVKANFGHGEAAAGIMAFIKSLLVLQKEIIPPHIGIKTDATAHFPKDARKRNMHIPLDPVAWKRQTNRKRTIIINNFGAAGGNTTVAMQEADVRERTVIDGRKLHAITISAKSSKSLRGNVDQLLGWLEKTSTVPLHDVAYTTTARRAQYSLRITLLVETMEQLKSALRSRLSTLDDVIAIPKQQPAVAFAFTGQGVFYTGLGTDLYHSCETFRRDVGFLDHLITSMRLPSVLSAIDGTLTVSQDLPSPVVHLAIVVVEIAMTWYWRYLGVMPQSVIGHSLGELAALNAAGVLSTADTLFVAGQRAQLLDRVLTRNIHQMLAVFATISEINDALDGVSYTIGLYNAPRNHVLTGTVAEITAITEQLKSRGVRSHRLSIPYAFHSRQMDAVVHEMSEIVRGVQFHPAKVPIISPQLAKVIPSGSEEIQGSYITNGIRDAVRYHDALEAGVDAKLVTPNSLWVEIGPHPVCMEFIKTTLATANAFPSLRRNESNWTTVVSTLAALHSKGVAVDWREYHRPFEKGLRVVDLPHYAWDNQTYWIQYQGDWLLTKNRGHLAQTQSLTSTEKRSSSSLHNITSVADENGILRLEATTNVLDPELLPIVEGHAMNDVGVLSSYVHIDIALAAADHLLQISSSSSHPATMAVNNLHYHDPVCVSVDRSQPQLIRTVASTNSGAEHIEVQLFRPGSTKSYAQCTIFTSASTSSLENRQAEANNASSRITDLRNLAESGAADRVSGKLAYRMFANLVDYGPQYRNMTSVVMQGLEAFAEITLPPAPGNWQFAPHWADALISLPGFVLNSGAEFDTKRCFFITPGWDSMMFKRKLKAEEKLTSYVKVKEAEEQGCYVGDVYIFDEEYELIGFVERVLYRRWPRVMLDRFFFPPDVGSKNQKGHEEPVSDSPKRTAPEPEETITWNGDSQVGRNSTTWSRALTIIAEEIVADTSALVDSSHVADLGIDSLMSLVLSQRIRAELGVELRDAFFLEVDTIGELRALIEDL